jgi:hypothetical protein
MEIGVLVHNDVGDLVGERAVHKAFTLIPEAAARPWVAAASLGLRPRRPFRKVEHRLGNRLRRCEHAESHPGQNSRRRWQLTLWYAATARSHLGSGAVSKGQSVGQPPYNVVGQRSGAGCGAGAWVLS